MARACWVWVWSRLVLLNSNTPTQGIPFFSCFSAPWWHTATTYSNDLRNRVMCARRNMIAKCMLGLHILLSYALLQDWKPVYTTRALLCQDSPICVSEADSRRIVFQGGQTPTPVMLAIGVLSFLYSLCCAAFPDSDPPTITSPRSKLNHDKKTI